MTRDTFKEKGWSYSLSAEDQIETEEAIASYIFDFQSEDSEAQGLGVSMNYLTEEDCADIGRSILYLVLRKFRPELLEEDTDT